MDKKHQVFISSTYIDLKEERQEVLQALLELDCIPVGMELFPAADEDQWTLIKRLINDCDYYILIVGGRYGSLNPQGISYTQMEYEYALQNGIPIISFLHKNPGIISFDKSEIDPSSREKLEEFKILVQKKLVKYWDNAADLGSLVSRSLVKLIRDRPRPGWVRADKQSSQEAAIEILSLKNKIQELETELNRSRVETPKGTEALQHGNDEFLITFFFKQIATYPESYQDSIRLSWDTMFYNLSPLMVGHASENDLRAALNHLIYELTKESPDDFATDLCGVEIYDSDFQTIKIQFRALGLITQIDRSHLNDGQVRWSLTPYGDSLMAKMRAIKKGQYSS